MFLTPLDRIVDVLSKVFVLIIQAAAFNWSDTINEIYVTPAENAENRHLCHANWYECILTISYVHVSVGFDSRAPQQILVLNNQVSAPNWSDTIYPNLVYLVKNAEIDIFATNCKLNVL